MNRSFVYNYVDKRDAAMPRDKQAALADQIFSIKKSAVADLRRLVDQAKASLEKSGAEVYVVKDAAAAREKVRELCAGAGTIVKSKSNYLDNLGIKEIFGDRLTETDLGAYIVSTIGGESDHPVLPAINLSAIEIAEQFGAKFGREYPNDPKALVDMLKGEIREKIFEAKFGLTGANAVTAGGQIMLLENEGNISLATRLPETHIAVCGVEKVIANAEDAVKIAQAAAVWGTGQSWPSYISFISGPSKTADIENVLVNGVQGAQRLALILVEGNAYDSVGTELESMLYCIHCGACYDLCPVWNSSGNMPKAKDENLIFDCTLCQNCSSNCPAKIDWKNISRICRGKMTDDGKNTENNLKMAENIRKYGNPFGEIGPEPPTELFCC